MQAFILGSVTQPEIAMTASGANPNPNPNPIYTRFRQATLVGLIGTAALVAVLVFLWVDGRENHLPFIYGLLPALPGLIALLVAVSALGQLDERERRILAASLLAAVAISMLVFMLYGAAQIVLDVPALNWALAAAFMSCAWGASLLVAWRRYS